MLKATKLAYGLREQAGRVLPAGGSNIPLDICLAVAHSHFDGNTLTMKQLVYELPYSEAGIQYNLRTLRDDGWLIVHPSSEDRRVRYLLPSTKLLEALAEFHDATLTMVESLSGLSLELGADIAHVPLRNGELAEDDSTPAPPAPPAPPGT